MATTFGEQPKTEEQVWPPTGGTKITMDTLNPKSNYMDLGIGKGVEFTVKEILKVTEEKYFFKDKNNQATLDPETGKGFKYLVLDLDGEQLSVNTWMLWNMLRQAFNDFGRIEGIQLRINHPERGKYTVHYYEEESNSWIEIKPKAKETKED